MNRYLFSEFKTNEFQALSQILCSIFDSNTQELHSVYNYLGGTFNCPGYTTHTIRRSFFKSQDEFFQKLYCQSPAVGVDLPSLLEQDNGSLDKITVAVVGQDPKRNQNHEEILLGTPYGLHLKGCREDFFRTKLYFDFIKVICELGYRVYLTDIFKIWVCNVERKYQGFKLNLKDQERFLKILKPELEVVQPKVIITWGKVSGHIIGNLELGIKHIEFPHPSGAANHVWKSIIGQSPSQTNKINFWKLEIARILESQ